MSSGAVEAVLVGVGEELLLGETVNTNAAWLGRWLGRLGVPVREHRVVGDREGEIRESVARGLERGDLVLVTGGLGPTEDDRTLEAVAAELGRRIRVDEELIAALRERFRQRGYSELPERNLSQARILEGAEILPNPHGTAPGMLVETEGGTVVLLPGVPREMKGIAERELEARLRRRMTGRLRPTHHRVIRTTGIPESVLAEEVEERLPDDRGPVTVAFLPGVQGVDIRLTARGIEDPEKAEAWLDRMEESFASIVEDHRYEASTGDLAEAVGERLRIEGLTVSVAESCTGGLVAKRLTDHPGASVYFQGGIVAYADSVKVRELNVSRGMLAKEGAVSEPVVRAMAGGVARRFGSDLGVGVTGIAGPGGGTEEKPVGTVWYAVTRSDETVARLERFPGDREEVRERTAQAALALLLERAEEEGE